MSLTKEQNKKLVDTYPYLKPVNVWTGKELNNYDYSWIEGDELPKGWFRLFLLLCKNIKPYVPDNFYFTEVKEKYGTLRVYTSATTEKCIQLVNLYEMFSYQLCCVCGNDARYETKGWVAQFCTACLPAEEDPGNCYKVYRKSLAIFGRYTPNKGIEHVSYSFRPIRNEYNLVKTMTDDEFVEYLTK